MKRATPSRVLSLLKKSSSLSYAQLAENFTAPQKLAEVLQSLEDSETILCDQRGHYLLSRRTRRLEQLPGILDRTYTGIAEYAKGRWYLRSLTPQSPPDIQIRSSKGLNDGEIVTVEIDKVDIDHYHGKVVSKIPAEDEASRAALALLTAFEVPHGDPWDPKRKKFSEFINAKTVQDRIDLRQYPFVTIDGESAKDFDDAVYVEPSSDGGWRMLVAIADVAQYVRPNDELDREARRRGNSVYLPDRVVPMLPEDLSNGICSLKPNLDRLAMVCEMQLSKAGKTESFKFYEAVIRSAGRLTYSEVASVCRGEGLRDRSSEVNTSLNEFYNAFRVVREVREQRGALDFTSRETGVRVQDGEPVEVYAVQQNEAHQMIEEAMILANVCAAQYLQQHNLNPLYRVHTSPRPDALEALQSTLRQCHIYNFDLEDCSSQTIQHLLNELRKSTKDAWIWELQVLRAMHQARYSYVKNQHFGLALVEYAHFTSPIRRYADLHLHRLIKSTFTSSSRKWLKEPELAYLGEDLSECERRATSVTRKVDLWLKCRLLKKLSGKTFNGVISGVEEFGIFVELDHYCVSGLIHVTDLGDDYYISVGPVMQGTRSGIDYRLGDRLKVVVVSVDVELGRIDLIEAKPRQKQHEFRRGKLKFHR
ncbi:MAG: VacB/RNase II family 3'-5' exoribonuclease [Gammaproteobacteria bacterium]|nr:VacB/RNase II family 3'-5' exoribonuclease [Gammaproteobacteria bacterium]MYF38828.1 VacB/RNase II family 3'-5' exoribonuclease [Gammaproteobacteria bacterium]